MLTTIAVFGILLLGLLSAAALSYLRTGSLQISNFWYLAFGLAFLIVPVPLAWIIGVCLLIRAVVVWARRSQAKPSLV